MPDSTFRSGVTLCAAGLFAAHFASASQLKTVRVELGAADAAAVTRAACPQTAEAAEQIRAYRYNGTADRKTWADVTCAADRRNPQGALRTRAVCGHNASRWQCKDEGEFLEVSAQSRRVHIPIRGVSLDTAAGFGRALLRAETYDGRKFANEIDGKACYLQPAPKDVNAWEAHCDAVSVHVARDCVKRSCTYRLFGPLVTYIP